ncbi:mitochondrial carrier domain-containing protein, partial [Gorgonomyces haynaldii]
LKVAASFPMVDQTVKELLAGSFGGIVQVLVGQPFDTVKVRLQTQSTTNPVYSGMVDCAAKTLKSEGILGFYKGTLTPLVGIGACVSIQFGALETLKRAFSGPQKKELTLSQLFLCGAGSGLANSVLSGPIEHVRIRLQVQSAANKVYDGPFDFLRKVYASHGFAGIYKAQAITMVREFGGYGIYFATYEYLIQKKMKDNRIDRNQVSAWHQLLYGALSGYALWLVIYPIDAIKSKLQTDAFNPSDRAFKSSMDCLKKTLAQQGVSGLYKGFWACMLRAGPANASTFAAYEIAMNLL